MATIIIKIEIEDINTSRMGNNIVIFCKNIDLVFTPESLEELLNDYKSIKQSELKTIEK